MAIDLVPAGTLTGNFILAQPTLIISKVWQPHAPPKRIGPGELDAVTTATDRIYWEWQDGPNWQTLVGIIGLAAQAVVSEQFQISEYRYLETGFGQILDELGAVVGLDRQGLGEELYRLAIRVRGASMISDAGIDAVTTPVKQLLGEDAVTYVPTYPASFMWVISVAVPPDLLALLLELLPPLIGAGIGAALLLAPPETPGWDSLTPQVWAASWSSSIGAVDDNVAAAWTIAVQVG
jgi:hypothetical protein